MNFDKNGYQLTLFPLQPSTSDDANHDLFFKNLHEFENLELTDP